MKKSWILLVAAMLSACKATGPAPLDPAPLVPSNVTAVSIDFSTIRFTWDPCQAASSYSWVLTDSKGTVCNMGKTPECRVDVSGLTEGLTYDFCVKASGRLTESKYSAVIKATAGGEIKKVDHVRLMRRDGLLWEPGDSVTVMDANGNEAVFVTLDNSDQALFNIKGIEELLPGSLKIVYPAGLDSLTVNVGREWRKSQPMAAKTDGLSAEMQPLCGSITISMTSFKERAVSSLRLNADTPLSGKVSIDWNGNVPQMSVDGEKGYVLDYSQEPVYVSQEAFEFAVPAPVGACDALKVSACSDLDTLSVPALGGITVLAGEEAASDCVLPDMMDLYSVFIAGLDIDICGKAINRSNIENYELVTTSALSYKHFATDSGVLFIDNADEGVFSYANILSIGNDRVVIGRYRDRKQPLISLADTKMLRLGGNVAFRNIKLTTSSATYGLLEGKQTSGEDGLYTWLFSDCTLHNSADAGIFRYSNSAYAVPKAMIFDNCIVRCGGILFETPKDLAAISLLREISMNNCVIAPYSASETVPRVEKDGIIVNFADKSGNTRKTDLLDMTFTNCSFYDMGALSKNRGMFEVQTVGMLTVDHCCFHHASSATTTFYTAYAKMSCTSEGGIKVSACYSDNAVQTKANKSNFAPDGSGRTWSVTVTVVPSTFDAIDSARDYFPVCSTVKGGASYNTKIWER